MARGRPPLGRALPRAGRPGRSSPASSGCAQYVLLGAGLDLLAAPGSAVVFSYGRTDEHLDEIGREFRECAAAFFTAAGEPIRTRLSRADAEALAARCGLTVADHPDRDDLVARYFAGRPDGLKPYTSEGVLAASC